MTKLFTLLGLALCWLPLQAQRFTPSQPQAAPYVLRQTSLPVKTPYLDEWFPQVRQLQAEVGPAGHSTLRLGGKGSLSSLSSVAIPVQAGQVVEAQFWAYAQKPAPWLTKRLPLAIGAAALSSQLSLSGRGEGGSAQAQSLTLPLLTAGAVLAPPLVKALTGGKKAYARLRLYDPQGRLVQESTQSLTKEARKGGELVSLRLRAPQAGFVQLQVVNQSREEVVLESARLLSGDEPTQESQPQDSLSPFKDGPDSQPGLPLIPMGWNTHRGAIPVVQEGGGYYSHPWELTLPTVTIRATVPPQFYTVYANGLYYVQAGIHGGYQFRQGFYRDHQGGGGGGGNSGGNGGNGGGRGQAPKPKPVTIVGGNGSETSPYQLEELVVRAQVPPTQYTYYGAGLYYLKAGTYANNPYPAGFYRDYSALIDNEKEIEVINDPCLGYKRMLDLQRDKKKEVTAFVTKDGKVFILPMKDNIFDKSKTFDIYYDNQGRGILSVDQAKLSDAPAKLPGQWYLTTSVYDAQGRPTNTTYLLTSHVHSHPINGKENEPSDTDLLGAAGTLFSGLDRYIVNSSCELLNVLANRN